MITAEFESGGEPYFIDFPLRIGDPFPVGPIGFSVGVIAFVLISVNVWQRRRLQRLKAIRHLGDKKAA